MLLLVIFFGCIIGNLMSSFIKKKIFGFFVDFLAIVTAISLLSR